MMMIVEKSQTFVHPFLFFAFHFFWVVCEMNLKKMLAKHFSSITVIIKITTFSTNASDIDNTTDCAVSVICLDIHEVMYIM